MCTPQKLIVTTFFKTMFVRICVKQDGFEMAKTLIWPSHFKTFKKFQNSHGRFKTAKGFEMASNRRGLQKG